MSKSKGNVVDPLDVVDAYGADVLRTYVLFMGDYASAAPWSDSSVRGCKRFLDRFADAFDLISGKGTPAKLESSIHKVVKKVSEDLEEMKFNTAIAAMMGLLNEIYDAASISQEDYNTLVRLLCPIAPHLCEELWEKLGGEGFCSMAPWPEYDETKTVDDEVELPVQINGKVRGKITVAKSLPQEEILKLAKACVAVQLEGKTLVKEIVVPGKLVSLVVRA